MAPKIKLAEVHRGGTGEAPWVKGLHHRHEDLSSVPQNPRKPDMVLHIYKRWRLKAWKLMIQLA